MGLARQTAALLGVALLATITPAAPALSLPADGSGNYTQLLCADPSSEEGLGLRGMPDGLSNPADVDTWQISASEVDCGEGRITPNRGVPLAVGQSNAYPQGTWSALLYEAPANATINGGLIYRAERAEGPNDGFMGIIQQGGDYESLYALPRNAIDQGDWFAGNVASRGTSSWAFSPANAVKLTISPDRGHWDVNATCDPNGNNDSSCTLAAGQWEYRIFGGEISLNASNDPQVSNVSGPLSTDAPLHGAESLTFSATDEGPGLAYVKLVVDGELVQSQPIDSNGGHCVPVAGRDAYTWAYRVPCKTSLGGRTYTFDSALVSDGSHRVQVIVEDAAGNESIVLDRSVTTTNATVTSPAPVPMPSSALPAIGAPLAPILGEANGTPASSAARLSLAGPRMLARSFTKRAFTASGRLLSSNGTPIGQATLDVLAAGRVIGHASTAADGRFHAAVPAGTSRTITLAYRAHSEDSTYSAEATIAESVRAGVQLDVGPHRTSSRGTITLKGRVAGPIPSSGVVVELLVHYRGVWEPFRTPRTNADGDFRVAYEFQGAIGRFPFRAEVPAGQSGFPYGGGQSNTVTIRTR